MCITSSIYRISVGIVGLKLADLMHSSASYWFYCLYRLNEANDALILDGSTCPRNFYDVSRAQDGLMASNYRLETNILEYWFSPSLRHFLTAIQSTECVENPHCAPLSSSSAYELTLWLMVLEWDRAGIELVSLLFVITPHTVM
jgi:hypothetical protein